MLVDLCALVRKPPMGHCSPQRHATYLHVLDMVTLTCVTQRLASDQRNISGIAHGVRQAHRIEGRARSVADRQCSLPMNAAEHYHPVRISMTVPICSHRTARVLTDASDEERLVLRSDPELIATRARMRFMPYAHCGEEWAPPQTSGLRHIPK